MPHEGAMSQIKPWAPRRKEEGNFTKYLNSADPSTAVHDKRLQYLEVMDGAQLRPVKGYHVEAVSEINNDFHINFTINKFMARAPRYLSKTN